MPTTGVQISALPVAPTLTGTELVPVVTVGLISGITQAVNAVVTVNTVSSVNPFSVGQLVAFAAVGGMLQMNGQGAAASAVGGVSGAWTITVPINSSGFSAYTSGGQLTATAATTSASMRLSATGSPYNPTFQSGGVQYAGPNGVVASDNNMIFGKSIPNPSGVNGPCLLLGSGGGGGTAVQFWLITDQAFDNSTPGNSVGMTAGETQPAGTAAGGLLWHIAGASFGGLGGEMRVQAGTSANAGGGPTVLKGGAATGTTSAAVPGDIFVEGGDTGKQGANVHLIATVLNGTAGVIRHRFNSTFTWDEYSAGQWYLYGGGGFGLAGQPLVSGGPSGSVNYLSTGFTGTVALAKLTTGGANGSLTIASGLITGYAPPT